MLTVSVENFGPIREGTVELRPLTTLMGPNNSGKSYMAMLIYAISRTLALDPMWDVPWLHRPASLRFRGHGLDVSERALAMLEDAEAREEALAWLASRLVQDSRRSARAEAVDIGYADLPAPLQQALQIIVEDCLESLAESLTLPREVQDCTPVLLHQGIRKQEMTVLRKCPLKVQFRGWQFPVLIGRCGSQCTELVQG